MANVEKMTENAVSKAMKPSLQTLQNIESGITKLHAQGNQGAEARLEATVADKKAAKNEEKSLTLLGDMVKGITDLKKTLMESMKTKVKGGFGALLAGITAPIIMLASFFKQLKAEFAILKSLTGSGLKKLFAPLKNLLKGEGTLGKALKGALKFMDKMSGGIFTKIGNFFKNFGQNKTIMKISEAIGKVKGSISKGLMAIKKFFEPVGKFFSKIGSMGKTLATFGSKASKIVGWASGFGKLLGKLFLPITLLMSAFDFVTGFMDGYDQGGILGGLEGGVSKLLKGLIGMPLDMLKDVVGWALGLMGFDKAKEILADFSFSKLIEDMIGGYYDMVKKVVDFVKNLFTDPVGALTKLWNDTLDGAKSIGSWIGEKVLTPITKFFVNMFKWGGDKLEKFDIMEKAKLLIKDITKWFGKIFDIDIGSIIKSMAGKLGKPGAWLLGKIGLGGGEPDDGAAAAAEAKRSKKQKEDQDASDKKTGGGFINDIKSSFSWFGDDDKGEDEAPKSKKGKKWTRAKKLQHHRAAVDAHRIRNGLDPKYSDTQKGVGTGGSAVKVSPKKVDLKGIDWDFISKKEGGSKTDGYVPNPEGSKSGVTIATGFDLGARNAEDLKGLPLSLKEKLSPYLGLQGIVASEYLETRPLTVTESEAKLIDKKSKGGALKKLKAEWNKNAAIMKTPMFEDLTGAQKTIAASVAFQYGSLKKAPKFRAAAQEGRWDDVQGELRNFGDDYASRRTSEADYLMAARQNNSGGQLNNLQVANANARQGGGGSGGSINVNKTNNSSLSSTVVAEAPRARKNLPLG
jgi:hypothetical protein